MSHAICNICGLFFSLILIPLKVFQVVCVHAVLCLVGQSCPTLCDAMDSGLPGSSVHGILQARILEWVTIPFFQGIFPNQGWILIMMELFCILIVVVDT